jgi:hypothetical protein
MSTAVNVPQYPKWCRSCLSSMYQLLTDPSHSSQNMSVARSILKINLNEGQHHESKFESMDNVRTCVLIIIQNRFHLHSMLALTINIP